VGGEDLPRGRVFRTRFLAPGATPIRFCPLGLPFVMEYGLSAWWPAELWRQRESLDRACRDSFQRPGRHTRILWIPVRLDLPHRGGFPGYTFVETGVPDALYTAISPLQGDGDLVTFFVGVQDIDATIAEAVRLGGRVVQDPVTLPGVSFALIADPQEHVVGLAQQS
jgi:hypothetical protein